MNAADRAQLAELLTALAEALDVPTASYHDEHRELRLYQKRCWSLQALLRYEAEHCLGLDWVIEYIRGQVLKIHPDYLPVEQISQEEAWQTYVDAGNIAGMPA